MKNCLGNERRGGLPYLLLTNFATLNRSSFSFPNELSNFVHYQDGQDGIRRPHITQLGSTHMRSLTACLPPVQKDTPCNPSPMQTPESKPSKPHPLQQHVLVKPKLGSASQGSIQRIYMIAMMWLLLLVLRSFKQTPCSAKMACWINIPLFKLKLARLAPFFSTKIRKNDSLSQAKLVRLLSI